MQQTEKKRLRHSWLNLEKTDYFLLLLELHKTENYSRKNLLYSHQIFYYPIFLFSHDNDDKCCVLYVFIDPNE